MLLWAFFSGRMAGDPRPYIVLGWGSPKTSGHKGLPSIAVAVQYKYTNQDEHWQIQCSS